MFCKICTISKTTYNTLQNIKKIVREHVLEFIEGMAVEDDKENNMDRYMANLRSTYNVLKAILEINKSGDIKDWNSYKKDIELEEKLQEYNITLKNLNAITAFVFKEDHDFIKQMSSKQLHDNINLDE